MKVTLVTAPATPSEHQRRQAVELRLPGRADRARRRRRPTSATKIGESGTSGPIARADAPPQGPAAHEQRDHHHGHELPLKPGGRAAARGSNGCRRQARDEQACRSRAPSSR